MRTLYRLVAALLSFPLALPAQPAPKFELFAGYSYLRLTEEPARLLGMSNLRGWSTSIKWNVAPRVGLLADVSGNYGTRKWTGIPASPSQLRQHAYLFGPEVRLLRRDRLSVNVRALLGVAQANKLAFPLLTPIERSNGLPPVTQILVPAASKFAASFGGSVDYRITDWLSYRIAQPEVLLIRSGSASTENTNQYNYKLSTGFVLTSGHSSVGQSADPHFSFGVIGGGALTDAFGHEATGFYFAPDGSRVTSRSRAYSTLKDYAIGPRVEFRLPVRSMSLEINALYRPMNLTMAAVLADGSLNSVSPATVVTWEFPILAKYRFGSRPFRPLIEAGPSFRGAGNLNNASPSVYGGTGGVGAEWRFRRLTIGPVIRYTHWAADADFAGSRSKRNQIELLVGLSF